MTADEILARLDSIHVSHPAERKASALVENLWKFGRRKDPSGSDVAMCGLLFGPTRVGKTTVLKRFLAQYPATKVGKTIMSPVLLVRVPERSFSSKTIATAFLVELGDFKPGTGNAVDQTARIYRHVSESGVKLVILDEFQHLVEQAKRGGLKIAYQVADWLKNFIDVTGCPVLLCGTDRAADAMNANGQLVGRSMGTVRLSPFPYGTEQERFDFRLILSEIDKLLPHQGSFRLSKAEIASRIHLASSGRIGEVLRLIRIAFMQVGSEGRAAIGLDDLANAYDEFAMGPNYDLEPTAGLEFPEINPFRHVSKAVAKKDTAASKVDA